MDAAEKLHTTIKKRSIKSTFKEKRISVMNHGDKVREKNEFGEMIEVL